MKAYADTSFVISLYSPDANSAAAASTMRSLRGGQQTTVFTTVLGELEIVNALELRIFRKEVSASEAQSSLTNFESDLRGGVFQLRPLSDQFFARARELSRQTTARLGTRTTDLLHVAAALELGVDRLYTFDQHQRKLAQALRIGLN